MKLCTYYTCGFPDIDSSLKIMECISEFSDYVEIGIPFSDPVADGPVIQFSSQKAIENGFKVKDVFPILRRLSEKFTSKRYVIMTYYNIVFQNPEDFLSKAKDSGAWGLAIPDLPAGQDIEFEEKVEKSNIKKIFFISPTTSKSRVLYISRRTTGFIYYITVKGVTGEREKLPEDLLDNIKRIKACSNKEVFVGFGISTVEQIKELKKVVDGVIIGSAIIRKVIQSGNIWEAIDKIKEFLEEIRSNLS